MIKGRQRQGTVASQGMDALRSGTSTASRQLRSPLPRKWTPRPFETWPDEPSSRSVDPARQNVISGYSRVTWQATQS